MLIVIILCSPIITVVVKQMLLDFKYICGNKTYHCTVVHICGTGKNLKVLFTVCSQLLKSDSFNSVVQCANVS